MPLHKEALLVCAEIEKPRNILGIRPRNNSRRKHHHIYRQLHKLTGDRVFRLDNQASRFLRALGNPCPFAADELYILFRKAVVKFFISFSGSSYIDIELINISGGFFLEKM